MSASDLPGFVKSVEDRTTPLSEMVPVLLEHLNKVQDQLSTIIAISSSSLVGASASLVGGYLDDARELILMAVEELDGLQ